MDITNFRSFALSLTPEQHHEILFYSPVLRRTVIPFLKQTDLFQLGGFASLPVQPSGISEQGAFL